jgi:hypothetical protein
MTADGAEGNFIPCKEIKTKDWYAWLNLMPPPPDDFHVVGEVYVPNPGVEILLTPKEPQGINPQILLIDIYLLQKPGNWPQNFVWKPARYDKILLAAKYTQVQIFCGDQVIADLTVAIVV